MTAAGPARRAAGGKDFADQQFAVPASQQQLGPAAAGRLLERQPGPVQPPVEGVEPASAAGPRPAAVRQGETAIHGHAAGQGSRYVRAGVRLAVEHELAHAASHPPCTSDVYVSQNYGNNI